ncbi:LysM peptidoglycan-binding domain-containing protein [Rhodobacter capsulatus]|uniref:LysM peptidoglycan-binding domain-containing protein n=1 Tax=Rhodobacter capsulatus TaxID=1061 RepID=UPI003B8A7BB3
MQAPHSRRLTRVLLTGVALAVLAGCGKDGRFDADLRHFGKTGFDTTEAVRQATADRPAPDARGVISYPNYQVAVARQGDSVGSIASRLGLDAAELARYNALAPNTPLGKGEVLALPKRVGEPAPGAVAGGAARGQRADRHHLAGGGRDRPRRRQSAARRRRARGPRRRARPAAPVPARWRNRPPARPAPSRSATASPAARPPIRSRAITMSRRNRWRTGTACPPI